MQGLAASHHIRVTISKAVTTMCLVSRWELKIPLANKMDTVTRQTSRGMSTSCLASKVALIAQQDGYSDACDWLAR